MNREKTQGFPSTSFGRFLRGLHASKRKTGFKRKRTTQVKSWVRGGVDGSSEEVDGGFRSPQLEQKMNGSTSGADEMGLKSDQPNMLFSRREKIGANVDQKEKKWERLMVTLKERKRRLAEMALHHYDTKKNCQFEFVQAMHCEKLMLLSPSSCVEEWCHLSFIGRSKNGVTEKCFFAELRKKESESVFNVQECCVLELEECAGFNHFCMICSPFLMFHPREGQYMGGASTNYRPVKEKCVTRADLDKARLRKSHRGL